MELGGIQDIRPPGFGYLETWEFSQIKTNLVRIYGIVSKTYTPCLIGLLARLFQPLYLPKTYNDIFFTLDFIQTKITPID